MLDISKVTGAVQRLAGKNLLLVKKHSPEILMAVGVVSFGGAIVTACTATMKVDGILDEHEAKLEKINRVASDPEFADEYSEQDAVKDKAILYIQTGSKIALNYLPTVTFAALSIGCFLGAHNIMSKRNVALLAAYKASEEALSNYREKVKAAYGEDRERQLFYGLEKQKVDKIVTDEKGKEKKVKEEIEVPAGQVVSQYARYFDECNPNWTKDPEQNRFLITCVQNMLNDRLRSVGHVFLNEAYEALGFKHSTAGAVVGWVYDPADGKDNYIDFNIFDDESFSKREFVNGYERSILLDFNVDGVIYDLI